MESLDKVREFLRQNNLSDTLKKLDEESQRSAHEPVANSADHWTFESRSVDTTSAPTLTPLEDPNRDASSVKREITIGTHNDGNDNNNNPGSSSTAAPSGSSSGPSRQPRVCAKTKVEKTMSAPTMKQPPAGRRRPKAQVSPTSTSKTGFICHVCNRMLTSKGNLKRHLLTHTGERPHKCNICDRAFARSDDLRVHMRIHTKEKPYKCKFCFKDFARVSDLRVHERKYCVAKNKKVARATIKKDATASLAAATKASTKKRNPAPMEATLTPAEAHVSNTGRIKRERINSFSGTPGTTSFFSRKSGHVWSNQTPDQSTKRRKRIKFVHEDHIDQLLANGQAYCPLTKQTRVISEEELKSANTRPTSSSMLEVTSPMLQPGESKTHVMSEGTNMVASPLPVLSDFDDYHVIRRDDHVDYLIGSKVYHQQEGTLTDLHGELEILDSLFSDDISMNLG